jgi:Domain found in Dishevelled, Egl-10, and Pleckstrin (DEP).
MRTASVSERIAQRLKDIQKKSAGALATLTTEEPKSETEVEEKTPPKLDKGKGKAVEELSSSPLPASPLPASPPPMSPPLPPSKADHRASPVPPMPPAPMLLAGLSLPPVAISQLLTRAAAELPLRPVRFPLLGEYQDCFTGEEFVAWLNENVQGFGGSLDRAEDAARDLTERDGLLRRIGEFGNQFEHSDDAFYQFRPKVSISAPTFLLSQKPYCFNY